VGKRDCESEKKKKKTNRTCWKKVGKMEENNSGIKKMLSMEKKWEKDKFGKKMEKRSEEKKSFFAFVAMHVHEDAFGALLRHSLCLLRDEEAGGGEGKTGISHRDCGMDDQCGGTGGTDAQGWLGNSKERRVEDSGAVLGGFVRLR
jgi:hypothetical protein